MIDLVAGVDLSSFDIHVALIPLEPIDEMIWQPVYRTASLGIAKATKAVDKTELPQRAWNVRDVVSGLFAPELKNPVRSIIIEKPMGHGMRSITTLYTIFGALSVSCPVQPAWIEPNEWRKLIGCNPFHKKIHGAARVDQMCASRGWDEPDGEHFKDALGVALATRAAVFA